MPYKASSGKWKWGNIARKSKEDLRKVVYGIWMKGGSKGSFSKFWEKGKVSESAERTNEMDKYAVAGYDGHKLIVKILTLKEVLNLLKENRHFDYTPEQLEKLKTQLDNPKGYYVDFQTFKFRILKIV